ncbi:MAG: hypothetical protein R2827_08590 [Bdellovibrionales bacterium]
MNQIKLELHPFNQILGKNSQLFVELRFLSSGRLEFTYELTTPMKVIFPDSEEETRSKEDLWKTTCFELFLGWGKKYLEINIAPDGIYDIFEFDSYRQKTSQPQSLIQNIVSRSFYIGQTVYCFGVAQLQEGITLTQFDKVHPTMVVESKTGMHYWATKHPSSEPDFHDSTLWTHLQLENLPKSPSEK